MEDIKNVSLYLPGLGMGITRGVISHYFEIKKIDSQLLLGGVSYKNLYISILKSTAERTIQFGIKKKKKNKPYEAIIYSSIGVTMNNIPYIFKIIKSNFFEPVMSYIFFRLGLNLQLHNKLNTYLNIKSRNALIRCQMVLPEFSARKSLTCNKY